MPSSTAIPANSFLRVEGREILDASGRPVLLRGVNIDTAYHSYLSDPSAPWNYATQSDIQYLDSLGVTSIRLSLHWRYFETALGYDLIDTYLNWCEQAGIYVVLDMHVVPPEDDILRGGIWNNSTAQRQFIDLWEGIAARYADRAIVAGYDLYNEPAPPNATEWMSLAERTTAAIRAVDANHILFVENPLTEDGAFFLIDDPNTVYSFHDYSPFIVSHAGATWVGDSPIPDNYAYPGSVLTGTEWVDWSEDASVFTGQTSDWIYWDSGVLTIPPGVEFATLKTATSGNAGTVWFDDLELEYNGVSQTIYNPGMEEASGSDSARPANWVFWSDTGFGGEWSGEQAHGGGHSLKISGDGDGFGVWIQSEWIFTEPLIRVREGDSVRIHGWIHAPQNVGGGVSLGLDYLNGTYEYYDRAHLLADMQPYIDWATANNVPLHVGEFGVMATAPDDSRWNWIADKIGAMNSSGLHWSLWTYREPTPGFGLYSGDTPDERLVEILQQGLETSNAISGTAGNDILPSANGNDQIDGFAGVDTVVFLGVRDSYSIARTGSGHTVIDQQGSDGTDTLAGIERLEFADKKVAIDLTPTGNTGQALEFIGMLAFPLVADPSVIGTIQSYFDNGSSMTSLCQTAINIGLIDTLAGSSSDLDLARLVYRNVIGAEADNATMLTLASYLQTSGGTYTRADFLATIAGLGLNQTHIGLIGLQETGVEYVI